MSTVFLEEVERFATYVGDAIVNEHIDTGNLTEILLAEENIGIPSIVTQAWRKQSGCSGFGLINFQKTSYTISNNSTSFPRQKKPCNYNYYADYYTSHV